MPTTRSQKQPTTRSKKLSLHRSPSQKRTKRQTRSENDIEANRTSDAEDELQIPETPEQKHVFDGKEYVTYQEMVDAKRERNQQVLQGLGILSRPSWMEGKKKTTASQRGIKRQPKNEEPLPRRKSSRLSSEASNLVALDYYVKDWNNNTNVVSIDGEGIGEDATENSKPKFLKGRVNDGSELTLEDAINLNDPKWVNEDSVASSKDFLHELFQSDPESTSRRKLRQSPTSVIPSREKVSTASITAMVDKISIDNEEWVAKVTPDRIYSVATHPGEHKLIACAGDKKGYVGIWDVDSKSDDGNGVHLFRVHSRSVCGLDWLTGDTMISSSYDGTVRRLNAEKGTFEEIFASYDDSDSYYIEELGYGLDQGSSFWHQCVTVDPRFSGSDPCLFVGTSFGTALHVDLRAPNNQRITFQEKLSEKKINTLSLHADGYSLASAGLDGVVRVWDIRGFGGARRASKKSPEPKPLVEQTVGLSVSSSYFSPSGKALLSTSFANRLDLVENAHLERNAVTPTHSIPHNNRTGRWLSTFMATWHPKLDVFVCGSMSQPRCMEIFDSRGELLRAVTGESLTSVMSRCCFHPSADKLIMVGGNSSGRMVAVR